MTSRLPQPGGDVGTWGIVLNDFLSQSHTPAGLLGTGTVGTPQLTESSVTTGKLVDASVTSAKIDATLTMAVSKAGSSVQSVNSKTPVSGAVTLVPSDIGAPTLLSQLADATITSPTDGQLLTYEASSSKWKNKSQTIVVNSVSGLHGNGTTDDSAVIQSVLESLGTTTHSNEVIVDAGSNGSVYINDTVEILSSNTTLRFNSPVIFGDSGTLRIWGELNENPAAGAGRPRLTANAPSGSTSLSVTDASFFAVGSYIVIRGLKDASGNPTQRMNNTVTGISGNTLTLGTPLDSTYNIIFAGSPYPNNYTEVTAVIGSKITAAANRGDRTIKVADSSQFHLGDVVQILDDDLNTASDGSSQSQNYLNREFADIKQIVDSTHIRISHALHHTPNTSNGARVVVTSPIVNSHILNANVTWTTMSTQNAAFWMEYCVGCSIENCSVTGNTTGGFSWQGQAFRTSNSYHCLVDNCLARDPVDTSAGRGYGATLYGATYCTVRNSHFISNRHSVLFYNGAAGCLVTGCHSEDVCISDYDFHGAHCVDNLVTSCVAIGGDSIPTDGAANKSVCKAGNPNHLAGDQYNTFTNMTITNYQGAAMEVVPGCTEITLRDSRIVGASIGLRLANNSSQTSLQTIRTTWDNVTATDIAQLTAIDGGSGNIVNGLVFDRVTWIRPTTGISVSNASNVTVRRNVFSDAAMPASTYAVSGNNITKFVVKDNDISGTVRAVYLATCPSARITRNMMHDLTDTTIYEDAGGNTNILFNDNEIFGFVPITRTSGTGPSTGGTILYATPYFVDTPALHNYVEWNFDPVAINSSSTVTVAGTIYMLKISTQTGGTINNVILYQGSNASGITTGLVGIYNSSGTRLGVSADQSSTWVSGTPVVRSVGLTGPVTLIAGQYYYVAVLSAGGTTQPGFARANTTTGPLNAGQSNATQRFATNSTGQTTLPSSLTLSSNSGTSPIIFWVGLS